MGTAQSSNRRVTAQDKAIFELKLQRDRLRQYQRKIQYILAREHDMAKIALAAGDKERALRALRQKRYQSEMLRSTDRQLETLQNLTTTIEFSLVQESVYRGLEQGNAVLKRLNEAMSIEKVDLLMQQSREAIEYQREVDTLLMSSLSSEDDMAVESELLQMQHEEQGLTSPPAKLPSVPVDPLPEPVVVPSTEPRPLAPAPSDSSERRTPMIAE